MEYNTQLEKLILPEYGRNIQNMVDYCLTIEDALERKRCANTIISIMGNMFPHLRDVNDFKHILWDHLAIMSDFKLDIEYPCEIIKKEDLYSKPGKVEYSRPTMRYRHYGKTIERIIPLIEDYEDAAQKEQLIYFVLNQMKRSYLQWNKEVEDEKIVNDLFELSSGKVDRRNTDVRLEKIERVAENPQRKQQKRK